MTDTAFKPRIEITRVFNADLDKVWRFWTSAPGIAQWWGPVGFESRVAALDVRTGGEFDIVLKAVDAQQVKYLSDHGIPLESHARGTYTEVDAPRRLAWRSRIDFVPGVAPYDIESGVDLRALDDGRTEIVFRSERMHDAMWTRNAEAGWTQQLDRLAGLLA